MIILVSHYEVLSMGFCNTLSFATLTGAGILARKSEECWEEVLYQVTNQYHHSYEWKLFT